MLSLIFNLFICLGLHVLHTFLFPKHSFILRLRFLSKIPRFIRVLSKKEYIYINQNGGSKMANASCSIFSNERHRHDITVIVKGYLTS